MLKLALHVIGIQAATDSLIVRLLSTEGPLCM